MPVARLNPGSGSATIEGGFRQFIPGVEPGMGIHNIFAQQRMKRVMMLQDAWTVPVDVDAGTEDVQGVTCFLKLSQEPSGVPGLLLPVSDYNIVGSGVASQTRMSYFKEELFKAHGEVFAPAWLGVRYVERGSMATINVDTFLRYEVVEVPWEQWFIMWDFLDNVVDLDDEY